MSNECLPKLLRALAGSDNAKEHRHDIILEEAAKELEGLRATVELTDWKPIEDAPRDGTLLLLLIEQEASEESNFPTENKRVYRTIGFNQLTDTGDDVWFFAGWCWEHDHFTEGNGKPIMWSHYIPTPANLEN